MLLSPYMGYDLYIAIPLFKQSRQSRKSRTLQRVFGDRRGRFKGELISAKCTNLIIEPVNTGSQKEI